MGYSLGGCKRSYMTKQLSTVQHNFVLSSIWTTHINTWSIPVDLWRDLRPVFLTSVELLVLSLHKFWQCLAIWSSWGHYWWFVMCVYIYICVDGSWAPEGIIKSLASVRPSFRSGYRVWTIKIIWLSSPEPSPSNPLPSFLAPHPSASFLFCPSGQLSCGKQPGWAVHTKGQEGTETLFSRFFCCCC